MREALLEIAVDHFSRFGFEGAATRAIATDCCTAMSSITYHFGGKEGLYLAAAEYVAGQIARAHGAALEEARNAPIASPAAAVDAMVALLDRFASLMLDEESARWASFITREQQEPTAAFDRIHAIAIRPLIDTFQQLIAIARPDLDVPARRATGFLLFGEVITLRAGRASLCRLFDLAAPGPAEEALLRHRLAVHARAILAPPLADPILAEKS